jgi:hypothetical protein
VIPAPFERLLGCICCDEPVEARRREIAANQFALNQPPSLPPRQPHSVLAAFGTKVHSRNAANLRDRVKREVQFFVRTANGVNIGTLSETKRLALGNAAGD